MNQNKTYEDRDEDESRFSMMLQLIRKPFQMTMACCKKRKLSELLKET